MSWVKTIEDADGKALTTDRAIINSSLLMAKALAAQMKTTIAALREFDSEIEKLCALNLERN